jgi:hypothetical protein
MLKTTNEILNECSACFRGDNKPTCTNENDTKWVRVDDLKELEMEILFTCVLNVEQSRRLDKIFKKLSQSKLKPEAKTSSEEGRDIRLLSKTDMLMEGKLLK